MNKEQSADDPSVDLIRVKNMLNSNYFYELPRCCVRMYRKYKVSLKHSEQLRQRCKAR